MGQLVPPASGSVYVDANPVLYSLNRHPVYGPLLAPLWQAAQQGTITIASSELVLLETLVIPLRERNSDQIALRQEFWNHASNHLLPVSRAVLLEAARLRADLGSLKTPDAIHAATCLLHGCTLFVTNDKDLRRIPGLPVILLDDILAAP
jgi:predicted nucleic acid-binding protein